MNATSGVKLADAEPKLAKPSLWLLMVWLTLSCVGIALFSGFNAAFMSQLWAEQRFLAVASSVLNAMLLSVTAAEILGFGVLVNAWRKLGSPKTRLLHQPGHWVIAIACSLLVMGVLAAIVSLVDEYLVTNYDWTATGWQVRNVVRFLPQLVYSVFLPVGLNLIAAYYHRGPWRWAFVALAILAVPSIVFRWILFPQLSAGAMELAFQWLSGVNLALTLVVLVIVGWAVSRDVRTRTLRDWVHWIGVASLIASQSVPAVGQVLAVWNSV